MFFDAGSPPFADTQPIIVKIGGSLTRQAERLKAILGTIARVNRPLAVVAGGGAFADAVRDAQRQLGFCDASAHRMAIIAMHQNAIAMHSLMQRIVPGVLLLDKVSDISSRLADGEKTLWLPLRECKDDPDLPANWETTSDAIAVRLAERLGGLPVVFVKARPPTSTSRDPEKLAAENLIDPVSAQFLLRSRLAFTIVADSNPTQLESLLAARETVDAANLA